MRINPIEELQVSVIIPTYNAGSQLEMLIDRLWNQTKRPLEIIVIDSTSTDRSNTLAERLGAKVLTVDQCDFDHGGTRNIAALQAIGNVLVFMTQDAIPANDKLLEELTRPLADEKVGYVYGRQLARVDASLLERISREYNYPDHTIRKIKADIPTLGIKTFFCSNACSAIRKDVFMQMGQFPYPVIFNEDMFMAAKCILADLAIEYIPSAKVIHSHNYNLRQLFKRYFDNGVSIRRNNWIYQYSSVNKEGTKLVISQLREIIKRREWKWIPKLFVESLAKYSGYQLGLRHHKLPKAVLRQFSMHQSIWNKLQEEGKVYSNIV